MGGDAGGDVRGGDVRDGAEDAGARGGEATNEGSAGGDKDQNRVWDPGGGCLGRRLRSVAGLDQGERVISGT
eukprot:SAG11_NODE_10781_length_805_cov_9.509915_1_plen_72_part_00